MSSKHLNDLKKMIESRKWTVITEEDGDEFSVSAIWVVGNRAGKTVRLIFEGMDDLSVLPIEKSYGCHIEEYDASASLYFSKNNKVEWENNLDKFADELKSLLGF